MADLSAVEEQEEDEVSEIVAVVRVVGLEYKQVKYAILL
jgi:hypothetical protein